MDEPNPMRVTLNGQSTYEPLVINTFNKPLCTKKLLLEICLVDDSSDYMNVQVDFHAMNVCFLDADRPLELQ